MKRSVGVTISAVIVLLGSGLTLLLGLGVAAAALLQSNPRMGFLRPLLLVEAVVFGCVAVLGVATGVDLLRLRRWARISVLVFAGLLCLIGFTTAAMILVIPLPAPPNAPAGFSQTMLGIRLGIAGFYLLLLALGAWWIWLFTRAGVTAQFRKAAPAASLSPAAAAAARVGVAQGRPVVVTIVAVLLLLGTVNGPVALALRFPAFVLGTVVGGWGAAVFYLGFVAAHVAIGIGLLKLRPWSRWAAIALYGFGMLNAATLALPGRVDALMEAVWSRFPAVMRPPGNFPMPPVWICVFPGMVVMAAIVWLLAREGKAFERKAA